MEAIRWQDDPWRRLPWLTTLAALLTLVSLMGFLRLLEQPPTSSRALGPVDVQVVELPRTAGAPARAAAVAPARPRPVQPPKPRAEVKPPPPKPEPQIEPPPAPAPPAASELARPAAPATESVPAPEPPPSAGPPKESAPSQPPAPATASVPPPGAASGTPSGADLGGGRMGARAIVKPLPEIPEALRHRTVDVVAVARFRVAASGAAQVDLIQPTSDPDLNRALLDSLKRWRFFPATQDGKPIASTVDIRIPISVR